MKDIANAAKGMGDKEAVNLLTSSIVLLVGKNVLSHFAQGEKAKELANTGDAFISAHKNRIALVCSTPASIPSIATTQVVFLHQERQRQQMQREIEKTTDKFFKEKEKQKENLEKEAKMAKEELEKKKIEQELVFLKVLKKIEKSPFLVAFFAYT